MAILNDIFACNNADLLHAEVKRHGLSMCNVMKEENGYTFSVSGCPQSIIAFVRDSFMHGESDESISDVISCIEML